MNEKVGRLMKYERRNYLNQDTTIANEEPPYDKAPSSLFR
jgi:hypothetical protein